MMRNMFLQFTRLYNMACTCAGASHLRRCKEVMPPTSFSKPNKVQQFQFQTSGILLFMGVKKLYGPEISRLFFLQYNWLQLVKTKNKWKIFHKEITKKETRKYNTSTYLTALSNRTVKKDLGGGGRQKNQMNIYLKLKKETISKQWYWKSICSNNRSL